MSTHAELVDGELVGGTVTPMSLDCNIMGVVKATQRKRQGAGCTIIERLYECGNGLSVAARRGGRLYAADEKTWEVWLLDQRKLPYSDIEGFQDEQALTHWVELLASYHVRRDLRTWAAA